MILLIGSIAGKGTYDTQFVRRRGLGTHLSAEGASGPQGSGCSRTGKEYGWLFVGCVCARQLIAVHGVVNHGPKCRAAQGIRF
jgi:hypothetical protein